jgi:hypothetical protein
MGVLEEMEGMSINGELGVRKNYVNDSLTANAFLRVRSMNCEHNDETVATRQRIRNIITVQLWREILYYMK